jgi:hypothetical protein
VSQSEFPRVVLVRSRFDLNPNPQHPSKEEDWKKLSSLFSILSRSDKQKTKRTARCFELRKKGFKARFVCRSFYFSIVALLLSQKRKERKS